MGSGDSMPYPDQEKTSAPRHSTDANSVQHLHHSKHPRRFEKADLAPDSRARLEALLAADVTDLRSVCDEICSVPALKNLILKLGQSLALHPSPPPANVQEAIVLLGTSRLRVVLHAWPLQSRSAFAGGPPSAHEHAQHHSRSAGLARRPSHATGSNSLLGDLSHDAVSFASQSGPEGWFSGAPESVVRPAESRSGFQSEPSRAEDLLFEEFVGVAALSEPPSRPTVKEALTGRPLRYSRRAIEPQ